MFAYQKAINDYARENLIFPTVDEIRSIVSSDETMPVSIEDMKFLEKAEDIDEILIQDNMLLDCFLTYRDNFSEIERAYTRGQIINSTPKQGEW